MESLKIKEKLLPIEHLFCPICSKVLIEPWECRVCGEVFCKKCVERLPKDDCPSENCQNKTSNFLSPSLKWLRLYESTVLHCPNDPCEITIPIKDFKAHIDKECEYRVVNCPNAKCQTPIRFCDLECHLTESCDYRKIHCPFSPCPLLVEKDQLLDHYVDCEYLPECQHEKCLRCYANQKKELRIFEANEQKLKENITLLNQNSIQMQEEIELLNREKEEHIEELSKFQESNFPEQISLLTETNMQLQEEITQLKIEKESFLEDQAAQEKHRQEELNAQEKHHQEEIEAQERQHQEEIEAREKHHQEEISKLIDKNSEWQLKVERLEGDHQEEISKLIDKNYEWQEKVDRLQGESQTLISRLQQNEKDSREQEEKHRLQQEQKSSLSGQEQEIREKISKLVTENNILQEEIKKGKVEKEAFLRLQEENLWLQEKIVELSKSKEPRRKDEEIAEETKENPKKIENTMENPLSFDKNISPSSYTFSENDTKASCKRDGWHVAKLRQTFTKKFVVVLNLDGYGWFGIGSKDVKYDAFPGYTREGWAICTDSGRMYYDNNQIQKGAFQDLKNRQITFTCDPSCQHLEIKADNKCLVYENLSFPPEVIFFISLKKGSSGKILEVNA